jgi:uncharacterized protein (DUF885 family)
MLFIASRTRVHDQDSAAGYLSRADGSRRFSTSTRRGCGPPSETAFFLSLHWFDNAIRQLRDHLSHPARDRYCPHRGPQSWTGAAPWREEIERIAQDDIRPAIGRYVDLLAELLPSSRPPERAGLLHLPCGVAAYACCIRNGATLLFDPDELHASVLRPWRNSKSAWGSSGATRWTPPMSMPS